MRKCFLLAFCVLSFMLAIARSPKTPEAVMRATLRKMDLSPAGEVVSEWVELPPADDKTWAPYIKMQAENGYDMRPHCGKTVQKLSCPVIVKGQDGTAEVHLFLKDEQVIGGDVMTVALDGYMAAIPPGAGD